MKRLTLVALVLATPVFAEGESHAAPFLSLFNTNFVVLLSFLIFIGILLYAGVPAKVTGLLDARAEGIRKDLAEAKALRDEAQALLDSFGKRQDEVEALSKKIVAAAGEEAQAAATKAKEDLADTIARRLKSAEDQIASAQAAAIKDVRDSAVKVAIAAAGDLIAKGMTAGDATKLIDDSITQVEAKLH